MRVCTHTLKVVAGEVYLGHVSILHRNTESLAQLLIPFCPTPIEYPVLAAHAHEQVVHGQPLLACIPRLTRVVVHGKRENGGRRRVSGWVGPRIIRHAAVVDR